MRKLLTICALLSICTLGPAQYFTGDTFDSYTPGDLDPLAGANAGATGGWDAWDGAAGQWALVVDGTVSGIPAHSGNQYIDCTGRDAVQPMWANAVGGFGATTGATYTQFPQSGAWTLTAQVYIPTGGVGGISSGLEAYFIVNNEYYHLLNATPYQWAVQTQFFDDGTGLQARDDNGGIAIAVVPYDTWIEVRVEVCLDNNTMQQFVGGTQISDRTWATTGLVEISNWDLFSPGGTIYFDTVTLAASSCPAPAYESNSANSSFDVDGIQANPFAAAQVLGFSGTTNHVATLSSALAGAGWDLAATVDVTYPSTALPGFGTGGGQAVNIDVFHPSFVWLNGGTFLSGHPGLLSLNFISPVTALPIRFSGQQVVLDPSHPDNVDISGAVEVVAEVCPTGVAEGFELTPNNWGVPFSFAPGWTATDSNPLVNGPTWRIGSGTTGSGGTGPNGAYEGTQYLFYEASCPNTPTACGSAPGPNIGNMESPPVGSGLELSSAAVVNPALIFAVHALGGGITGTFKVQEFNQVTMMWDDILDPAATFNSALSQGADDWKIRKVPLSNFGTGGVQVRFQYDTGLTAWWQGDICIDQLAICEQ